MKYFYILIFSSFVKVAFFAQLVNVPDVNFKSYLLSEKSINTNGDGEIQVTEATTFAGHINVSNLNISDLTGIEAFTSLKVLNCFSNNLNGLDLSGNLSLQSLYCNNNQISTLDLSANPGLFQLQCNNNQLTSLDLTANVVLKYVYCQQNAISNLNITGLNDLAVLFCSNNDLNSVNISDNDSLIELDVSFNNISTLSLVECKKLQVINVEDNNLSIFNTMANTKLVRLDCSGNNLTELRMSNGWNHKLKWFDSKGNANLTCIEIDDDTWANNNLAYGKDSSVNFSEICP